MIINRQDYVAVALCPASNSRYDKTLEALPKGLGARHMDEIFENVAFVRLGRYLRDPASRPGWSAIFVQVRLSPTAATISLEQ